VVPVPLQDLLRDPRIPDDLRPAIETEIADLQRAMQGLGETERRYRQFAEASQDVLWTMGLDLRLTYVSSAVERLFGFAPDDYVGMPFTNLMAPDSAARAQALMADVLEAEAREPGSVTSRDIEVEFRRKDGSTLWTEVRGTLVRDDEGRPTGIAGVTRDISRRRAAARTRREAEQRLELALKGADLGAWDWDMRSGVVTYSERCGAMLGLDPSEVTPHAREWLSRVHPDDRKAAFASLRAHHEGTIPFYEAEHRLRMKSGEYRWMLGRGQVTERDEGGRPVRVSGTLLDIDERKRAALELAERQAEEAEFSRLLGALHEVTLELASLDSEPELCRQAVELGRARLGFARLGIWFADGGPDRIRGSYGIDEQGQIRDERAQRLRVSAESAVGRVLLRRERAVTERDVTLMDHNAQPVGAGTSVKAAMWDGAAVVGCLCVDDLRSDEAWSGHRTELAALYAHSVGHLCSRLRARTESEARFRSLFDQMLDGAALHSIVLSDDGRPIDYVFLAVNPAFERMTGLTAEAVLGRRVSEAIPGIEPRWVERYGAVALGGPPIRFDDYAEALGRWFSIAAFSPAHGQFVVLCQDITERLAHEQELRQARSELQLVLDAVPARIWLKDAEGRYLRVNRAAAAYLGVAAEDVVGRAARDFFPRKWERYHQEDLEVLESGRPKLGVLDQITTQAGEPRWTRTDRIPVTDDEGRVTGITAIVNDITEAVLAERERQRNGIRLEALLGMHHMPDATEADLVHFALDAAVRLTGSEVGVLATLEESDDTSVVQAWSGPALLGLSAGSVREQVAVAGVEPWARAVSQREWVMDDASPEPFPHTLTVPVLEGDRVVALGTLATRETPYSVTDARNTAVLLQDMWQHIRSARNERERDALAAQLQRTQRLESIGLLAGGIAHDFNNILASIMGFSEIVLEELPPGSPGAPHMQQILAATERARSLVRQILAFSRQAQLERRPAFLTELVEEVLRFVRASIPSTVEIRPRIDRETRPVLMDTTQIHQVLMNLCTNAEHAMRPGGGVLGVALSSVEIGRAEAQRLGDLAPGRYAVLAVSDTGCGIDEATRERIFDPFFTTKRTGEGTGLGLATSYGIVVSHGGAIAVESEAGVGSTFSVYLPCIAEPTPATREGRPEPLRGSERVLFVDDEPALVAVGRGMLSSLGYEVTATPSSQEALELLRADPAAFDIVVTDMTMPHLTGLDLAAAARELRRDLPVLLTSGLSQSLSPWQASEAGVAQVLPKPYTKPELAAAVRRALAQRSSDA
jgi:PAS domain S-box-containing protein